METNERILKFIEYKGISVNAFEKSISKSTNYVRNSKSFTSNVLAEIMNIYPELNIGWLITGNGEMLKEMLPLSSVSNTVHGDVEGGFVGSGVLHNGNVIGDGNNVGIIPADYEKKLIRAQVEIDYLKKENKTLKDQLKQAMADKDKAMSMLDKALNK